MIRDPGLSRAEGLTISGPSQTKNASNLTGLMDDVLTTGQGSEALLHRISSEGDDVCHVGSDCTTRTVW